MHTAVLYIHGFLVLSPRPPSAEGRGGGGRGKRRKPAAPSQSKIHNA